MEITASGPSYQQFGAEHAIRVPFKTEENPQVELGFVAQIPSLAQYKYCSFIVPSSRETLPEIGFTN